MNFYIILLTIAISTSFRWVSSTIIVGPSEKVALDAGHPLTINCRVNDDPQAQFHWFRIDEANGNQNRKEQPIPTNTKRIIITNGDLKFKSAGYSDVGDYICRLKDPKNDNDESQKIIAVRIKPYIEEFDLGDQSALLVAGQKMMLNCIVRDTSSTINIQWYRSKFSDDNTEFEPIPVQDERFQIAELNKTTRMLTIDPIQQDDRRYYQCRASNEVAENSRELYVRIKDPLAAVWPAVGIITELFVIFSVIFISENRRIQPESIDEAGSK